MKKLINRLKRLFNKSKAARLEIEQQEEMSKQLKLKSIENILERQVYSLPRLFNEFQEMYSAVKSEWNSVER